MANTLCTTTVSSFAGSAAVTSNIPSPPVTAANGSCSPVRRRRSDGSLPSHSNAPTVADPTNPPTASGGGDEHHPASPELSYLLAGDVEDGRRATDTCSKGVFDSLSDIQMKSDALRLHQRRGATRRRALHHSRPFRFVPMSIRDGHSVPATVNHGLFSRYTD